VQAELSRVTATAEDAVLCFEDEAEAFVRQSGACVRALHAVALWTLALRLTLLMLPADADTQIKQAEAAEAQCSLLKLQLQALVSQVSSGFFVHSSLFVHSRGGGTRFKGQAVGPPQLPASVMLS
jgi:hypothetical protein